MISIIIIVIIICCSPFFSFRLNFYFIFSFLVCACYGTQIHGVVYCMHTHKYHHMHLYIHKSRYRLRIYWNFFFVCWEIVKKTTLCRQRFSSNFFTFHNFFPFIFNIFLFFLNFNDFLWYFLMIKMNFLARYWLNHDRATPYDAFYSKSISRLEKQLNSYIVKQFSLCMHTCMHACIHYTRKWNFGGLIFHCIGVHAHIYSTT